jgi:hypothetical protein
MHYTAAGAHPAAIFMRSNLLSYEAGFRLHRTSVWYIMGLIIDVLLFAKEVMNWS